MASIRVQLVNMPGFSAKAKNETFSCNVGLPFTVPGNIRINSATIHMKYVRIYNEYCYLHFQCGTTTGYTAVFADSDGKAVTRDATVTFTNVGDMLT